MLTTAINNDIVDYIKDKTRLFKHFGIKLNNEQRQRLSTLTSEIAVDNFSRSVIISSLDELDDCNK